MADLVPAGKKRRHTGRKTLLNFDMERLICTAIQLGSTDAKAARACKISPDTLVKWLRKGEDRLYALADQHDGLNKTDVEELYESEDPQNRYVRFFLRVQDARKLRLDHVLARLPRYNDWKADDAYIKHLKARAEAKLLSHAKVRKAEAEARIAEAKAAAIEEVTSTAGGIVVVGLSELLDDPRLTGPAREALELFVAEREGLGMLEARDLAGDVSDEEVEAG